MATDDKTAHFNGTDFIGYFLARRGLTAQTAGIGKALVMTWIHPGSLVQEVGAEPAALGRYGITTAGDVSILRAPPGAPATAMLMEEMLPLGVRHFVGVGLCGSLDPALPIGSLLIAGEAHRDEGTSYHYLDSKMRVSPSPVVVAALRQAAGEEIPVVPHWTTDAIYRETKGKIRRRQAAGVKSVDMEASAVYAVASCRGAEAALVLAVSDELWGPTWRAGFEDEALLEAKQRALQIGWKAGQILASEH